MATWFIALGALLAVAAFVLRTKDRSPTRPSRVRATPFRQRDVTVRGMRLRYVDEGSGPPILLIPGHTSRVEEYDALVTVLHRKYRVLVFDFPGTGYSDKPVRRYDLRFYEDVALGFLDALGIDACRVAGGSLGGNLALRLAHRDPRRFTAVAAWSPGSAWEPKPIIAACMWSFPYAGRLLFWPVVRIQSTYWYRKGWRNAAAALQETFRYYREVLSPGFIRMYWGIAADQMGWSLFGIAPGIGQRALLLWGDRDHGLRMGDGVKRIHRLMPNAELIIVPNAGHALAAERPRDLARHLLRFFATLDAP